jgi:hypothetical protein
VASGNVLTVIQERGQAYPWDMLKQVEIQRPPAIVATRTMPFDIAGLAIGQFGQNKGNSLALLSSDGGVYILEPTRAKAGSKAMSATARRTGSSPKYIPHDVDPAGLALINPAPPESRAPLAKDELTTLDSLHSPEQARELMKMQAEALAKLSKEERAQLTVNGAAQASASRERVRIAFLKTISARPSTLSKWRLQTTEARLPSAGSSPGKSVIAARVSASGMDDLVLIDSGAKKLHIVSQGAGPTPDNVGATNQRQPVEVVSLGVENNPVAVLPMRLNADALSDLVVLRDGAAQPSIVLTTAANTYTVNDASDDLSSCAGGTCTLRGAIGASNLNPGSTIAFNIPGAGV